MAVRIRASRVFIGMVAILVLAHLGLFLFAGLSLLRLRTENPKVTSIMRYRGAAQDQTRPEQFLGLESIPEEIIYSTVYIEDLDFFHHRGFDFDSIRYAIQLNRRLGYRAYGGSTITQQLARTLFLTPRKNYVRKYVELLIALEMELILTKQRILELYLNYAEWGNGIYGVSQAAEHYFAQDVFQLSLEEKLRLVTVLPSPLLYSPHTFASNPVLVSRYRALLRLSQRLAHRPPTFRSQLRRVGE